MQKTIWWRVLLFCICAAILVISFIWRCDFIILKCLGGNSIPFTRTMVHFSSVTLFISFFIFFVSDTVFKKWLRFALIWFVLTFILIMLTPVYSGGWEGPSFTFTKELVSIWMGSLFVIISLIKLIFDSRKSN